jgi:hypothetical protein
MVHFHELV